MASKVVHPTEKDTVISNEVKLLKPGLPTIMVAGQSRSGKSTALNNIFGLNLAARASPVTVTRVLSVTEVTKKIPRNLDDASPQELTMQVIDVPGLSAADIPRQEVLNDIKRVTKGVNVTTLLYCQSVSPYNILLDIDKTIITDLHHFLGAEVWSKCLLLFTFSDYAYMEFKDTPNVYVDYIKARAHNFEELLESISGKKSCIKSIFEYESPNALSKCEKPSNIIAIPVKRKVAQSKDILQGMIESGQDWTDVVFIELMKKIELQKKSLRGGQWLPDIAGFIPRWMTKSSSNKDDTMRRLELQLQECQTREKELRGRFEEMQTLVDDANRRAGELQTQVDDANRRAGELQTQVDDANRRAEASNRRAGELHTQVDDANRRAEASNRRAGELHTQVLGAEDREQDLQRSLAETTQELRQYEDRLQANSTHWVVRREEIELTGPELGVGGWATVTVAEFRGIQVAVKRIHKQIISHHNLQLFQREMNMAARLRHPNLIQFIGATLEGEMMIVMELMATSLRSQLQSETYFQPLTVKAISLDVARGLNYLHLIQPDPIVHRDISSANVLLDQLPLGNWRAKLTDYGSVNLLRLLRTENPGSPAYAAPEASNPRLQSPKMDVYSFGALVLEMLTGQLPAPDDRLGLLRKVQHQQLLRLIRRCLNMNPEDRPSACDIISELNVKEQELK